MPPSPDLSFTGLDEFVNKLVAKKCEAKSSEEETKVVRKNNDAPIIKEWVSDDEEENRMVKPVWNNAHRVNHQNFAKKTHPCAKKNIISRAVLMKSGLLSVNIASEGLILYQAYGNLYAMTDGLKNQDQSVEMASGKLMTPSECHCDDVWKFMTPSRSVVIKEALETLAVELLAITVNPASFSRKHIFGTRSTFCSRVEILYNLVPKHVFGLVISDIGVLGGFDPTLGYQDFFFACLIDLENFGTRIVVGVDDTQVVVDKLDRVSFAFHTKDTVARKNLSFVTMGSWLVISGSLQRRIGIWRRTMTGLGVVESERRAAMSERRAALATIQFTLTLHRIFPHSHLTIHNSHYTHKTLSSLPHISSTTIPTTTNPIIKETPTPNPPLPYHQTSPPPKLDLRRSAYLRSTFSIS
nr:hypothetical protein [Tanacetum cinerariifolium]